MTAKTETKSRFYIGQTIIETRDTIKNKIDAQTKKNIKARVETSRKFISDLKKNPGKQFDSFIDDNKKYVKEFTNSSRTTYKTFVKESKTTMEKVIKGVTEDAKLVVSDVKNMKNKTFDTFTSKKSINKRVNKIAAKIPSRLNLPSKDEIQGLMTGVDGINKKVDRLNKLYA